MEQNTSQVVGKKTLSNRAITVLFLKTGALSFGGWSTTAVLLEKELSNNAKAKHTVDLDSATAYAQILPGATQVALVSNVGYQLRGIQGALIATVSYLLPAVSLMIIFAWVYFNYMQEADISLYLSGLIPALAGIILANAYRIGRKHVTHPFLWLVVIMACVGLFIFSIHALVIIMVFGLVGLMLSLLRHHKAVK